MSLACRSCWSVTLAGALGLMVLVTVPAVVGAADKAPPDNPPAGTVQSAPAVPGSSQDDRTFTETEVEKAINRLPSRYRIRNAPTTRADPTWSGDNAAALRNINRTNRKIGQDMRRLDNSIRNMNTSINRTRTIRRSRGF